MQNDFVKINLLLIHAIQRLYDFGQILAYADGQRV